MTKTEVKKMKTMTFEEWKAEGLRRGNGDLLDAPFACPACGNVATPRQFLDLGEDPNHATNSCIGRAENYKGEVGEWGKTKPCNWAAFGLFGTLGKGIEIVKEDGGTFQVFDFAEVQA